MRPLWLAILVKHGATVSLVIGSLADCSAFHRLVAGRRNRRTTTGCLYASRAMGTGPAWLPMDYTEDTVGPNFGIKMSGA